VGVSGGLLGVLVVRPGRPRVHCWGRGAPAGAAEPAAAAAGGPCCCGCIAW
jgi:hypothetical protein